MQYQIEICFNRLLNGYFVGVHRQVVPWYLRNTRFGENLLFLLSPKIDIGFIFVATGSDVVSIWSGKTQLTTTPNPLYSDNKLVTKTRVTWFMWQQSSLYQMSLGKLTTFWFGSSWFYVGLVLTVLGFLFRLVLFVWKLICVCQVHVHFSKVFFGWGQKFWAVTFQKVQKVFKFE